MSFNRDDFKVSCTHVRTHHDIIRTHLHIQGLVCVIVLPNGRHSNLVTSDFYVRSFLERNPELAELKTANVGHHRAKQATEAVRDAVFKKLQVRTTYQPHPHTNTCLHAYTYRTCLTAWLRRMYSQPMNAITRWTCSCGFTTKWVVVWRVNALRCLHQPPSLGCTTARALLQRETRKTHFIQAWGFLYVTTAKANTS